MGDSRVRSLAGATLRASRRYYCVPKRALSRELRARAAGFADDPRFFGLLASRTQEHAIAISHDTARVFLALRRPGPVPADIRETLAHECDAAIAKLTLEGILEVEAGTTFVSGPDAFEFLFPTGPSYTLRGRLGELALDALRTGDCLRSDSSATLAMYLYTYNTVPASPRWRRRFPTDDAVLDYLRTPLVPWTAGTTQNGWTFVTDTDAATRWMIWERGSPGGTARLAESATYKLYISPTCALLRNAFHTALPIVTESQAIALKVGRDLPGLLRPDKLVVYFRRRADLMRVVDRLATALAGISPQGVPFSASLTENGLLSWGVDPPPDARAFGWKGGQSWRIWVSNRLAASMMTASAHRSTVPPSAFALASLELEGIDPQSFAPTEGLWAGSGPV